MANDYDRILKENIAEVFLPLSEKYLGLRIVRSEQIREKLQTTIEKEPDFIRIVETDSGLRLILHLEFQTSDEEGMVYRMQEYYSLLRRKHRLPVRQFVVYLGRQPSRMQTTLPPEEIFTGFGLASLHDQPCQTLLDSEVPEEVLLAILADFEGRQPSEVLGLIIERLRQLSGQEIVLRKYIRQLSVLARLRNLSQQTKDQINKMALTYDIKQDAFYVEGVQEGSHEKERRVVLRMLRDKTLTVEKIAELAEVPVDYVHQLQQEMDKQGG